MTDQAARMLATKLSTLPLRRLACFHSHEGNRYFADSQFLDQLVHAQVREMVLAYLLNWDDRLALVLCHQKKSGVHLRTPKPVIAFDYRHANADFSALTIADAGFGLSRAFG